MSQTSLSMLKIMNHLPQKNSHSDTQILIHNTSEGLGHQTPWLIFVVLGKLIEPPLSLRIVLVWTINYMVIFHYRPGIFFPFVSFLQSTGLLLNVTTTVTSLSKSSKMGYFLTRRQGPAVPMTDHRPSVHTSPCAM